MEIVTFKELCQMSKIPEQIQFIAPVGNLWINKTESVPEGVPLTVVQANYRYSMMMAMQIPFSVWVDYNGQRITIQLDG